MEDNCLMGHGSFSPLFSSLAGHRASLFDKGVYPLLHRPADAADLPPACEFMELLGHHQKFEGLSSVLDGVSHEMMNPSVTTTTNNAIGDGSSSGLLEASEVSNPFPATPNSSSISSASNDDAKEEQLEDQDLHPHDKTCTKQPLKPKKTNQNQNQKKKKQRESRIAFMTKSEVDHLEDGYRWRKYGQKAVKKSPFPRSYYRCTNAACNVKKRVERCLTDPSMVITTYEGQHTHPSPIAPHNIGFPTGFLPNSGFSGGVSTTPTNAATLPPQMSSSAPTNLSSYLLHDNYVNGCFPSLTFNRSSSSSTTTTTSTKFQSYFVHGSRRFCNPFSDGVDLPRANGLLQDIVPSHLYNAP